MHLGLQMGILMHRACNSQELLIRDLLLKQAVGQCKGSHATQLGWVHKVCMGLR